MIPAAEIVRIAYEEASYLVFRRRVPLEFDDAKQDAAEAILRARPDAGALARVVARRGLMNAARKQRSRPLGMRGDANRHSAGAPYAGAEWLDRRRDKHDGPVLIEPPQLRSYPDRSAEDRVNLAWAAARRKRETGYDTLRSVQISTRQGALSALNSMGRWLKKNPRSFD